MNVQVEGRVSGIGERSALIDMPLEQLAAISDEEFKEKTRGSAIRRAKAEGIRRNAHRTIEHAR